MTGLLRLRPRSLHHLRPFLDLGLDVVGEFLRRAVGDLEAHRGEALGHGGVLQRFVDLGVQARDDGFGCACRGEHAEP